jgi:hypothetical protein
MKTFTVLHRNVHYNLQNIAEFSEILFWESTFGCPMPSLLSSGIDQRQASELLLYCLHAQ